MVGVAGAGQVELESDWLNSIKELDWEMLLTTSGHVLILHVGFGDSRMTLPVEGEHKETLEAGEERLNAARHDLGIKDSGL